MATAYASTAASNGASRRWADTCSGPTSMANPPLMKMMTKRLRANVPAKTRTCANAANSGDLVQRGEQPGVLFLPLRRQRPLGAHRLVGLGAEEGVFHAAVDDVPRQHAIVRAIAEDEEL